jgi:hypothetical protein
LVETRLLWRFLSIPSSRLIGSARGDRRSLACLDSIDPPLVRFLRDKVEPELLANHTSKKATHGMLLPLSCDDERRNRRASRCSRIAMTRSCFVADRAGDLEDAGIDRWGNAGLAVLRAGRCLRLSLTFGHGILEVYAAPSAAPPQPHTGKYPVGQIPEAGRSRSKSPQAMLRLVGKASQF